jgi:hypothetical protein
VARSKWDNTDKEGRRLEKIIRLCETNIVNNSDNNDLVLAYLDRLIKATHTKIELIESIK